MSVPVPFKPRITKSTAVAAIKALFESEEALLKRFEIAKTQANLWDGERDGLREAVKTFAGGKYGRTVLSWGTTAPVLYPNAEGKFQIEHCLQINIPKGAVPGCPVVVFAMDINSAEEFLDKILHELQKSKTDAIQFLNESFIGKGQVIENTGLYDKKGADKATITEIPED